MNRLKVFLYVALVTASGAAGVHLLSRWLAERTLRQVDRDLAAAASSIQARAPALGADGLSSAEALRGLRRELGVDVTLLSEGRVVQSTLPPGDAALVAGAGREAGGRPSSAGKLGPQRPALELPFPAPALPLVLVRAPAQRVLTVPVPVGAGLLAVSEPAATALMPVVTAQWLGLVTVALLFLVGLLFVLLVTNEPRAVLPRELLAAADRVARGDFAARAPVMAGRLGTFATALNRAAEAASAAPVSHPRNATGAVPLSGTGLSDLVAAPVGREPAFVKPPDAPPPTEPEPEPLAALDGPAPEPVPAPVAAGGEEPAPPSPAEPPPAPPSLAEHEEATARDFFAPPAGAAFAPPPPEPSGSAAPAPIEPAAPPAPAAWAGADEDEEHWKAVYQDFQRVRAECGESRDGVAYERFRDKLQKNRDQLVERYGCRTVRFQVYAKDGKAALKASPVR